MPYVAAGVALTRLKLSYEAFGFSYGTASTMPGIVFGAGFQYAFGNGWSAGLEYLYTSYGNQDFSSVVHTGFPGDYSDDQSKLTTQTIRFVANYKFGATSQAQHSLVYNWTGFYIGVHGGYEDIWSKGSDAAPLILAGCCGLTEQQIRGASGGIQFGYNFQAGAVVFGTEIAFSAGGLSRSGDCLSINPALDVSCRLKAEWTGRLLAKLGYAIGDGRLVPYLAGGLAFTQFNTDRSFDDGFGPLKSGGTQIAAGVIAGLGLQYAITSNLSLGLEYLFTQYAAVRDANFTQGTVSSQNISSDTARILLNYRFDSGAR
jgi:outer membrane immunogenic protein